MWCAVNRPLSVGLLATALCVGVLSEGGNPETASPTPPASLVGTLDQLWAFVERLEGAAGRAVLAGLDSRLEQLHGRLTAQLAGLAERLDGCRPDAELAARVSELCRGREDSGRLETISARLETLSARLETLAAQLNRAHLKPAPPRDCSDLLAGSQSGIYLLRPGLGAAGEVPAYCDLDTDGGRWTVIQRRADIEPREDFYREWAAYKEGFGELDGEFWWGLDNMWTMTSPRDRQYELRIDLEDFEGERRHAIYQNFRISSESDGYRLNVVNYTGNASDGLAHHVGIRFHTKDRDNFRGCAADYKGAWWYNNCHDSNLNGQYLAGPHTTHADGVNWELWRGNKYSLKAASMKIRPTRKALNAT
ncbi:techylectin-5A-like [Amphibalanus amphitrite]|uniref:techylectin-5A-like n=1 Tax=Amphibalanus amphitrite TaxID=1232801 RepID=UPI001C907C20|nr:techylectin-5A-like [Amphibalanus amphitrite]